MPGRRWVSERPTELTRAAFGPPATSKDCVKTAEVMPGPKTLSRLGLLRGVLPEVAGAMAGLEVTVVEKEPLVKVLPVMLDWAFQNSFPWARPMGLTLTV